MQAFSSSWTAPGGTLGTIVEAVRGRAESLRGRQGALERLAGEVPAGPSLAAALRSDTVALLTEVKRRSPSKGAINPGLAADEQARAYVAGGAAGISVLTEPEHFGGSPEDLVAVRRAVPVPVLKKDFHVEAVQLLEARALGASAVLLIARALAPHDLPRLVAEAHALGLEVLLEVRDEPELERALDTDAAMIGINNRDLETLAIDPETSVRLLPRIPRDRVAIAESGMQTRADVERVAAVGADAVLVGSSISAAADAAAAVRALAGVRSAERGR